MRKLSKEDSIWKKIKNYENEYEVSSKGDIKSIRRNKILKPSNVGRGYPLVVLSKNGKIERKLVSRIVCETFNGPPPNDKYTVNHRNGIKTDNMVDNLEWSTMSENIKHSFDVLGKTGPRGSKCGKAILNEEQVLEIRKLFKPKDKEYGRIGLSKKFGIHTSTIDNIIARRSWKYV